MEQGSGGMNDLAIKLDAIRRQLLHWCDSNKEIRRREGCATEDDTHIIAVPPHWPTHGVLRRWAATIEEAQKLADANSNPSTQNKGERAA
jgi:hypothetical protein